jgi:hypothetical protein
MVASTLPRLVDAAREPGCCGGCRHDVNVQRTAQPK